VRNRLIGLFALMGLGGPAIAQDSYLGGAYINAGIGNAGLQAAMQGSNQTVRRPLAVPRSVATTRLSYHVSLHNRSANLANFVSRIRKTDPTGAKQLETLFASTDVIGRMSQALAGYGLHSDNIADAYAVWWSNSWQVAHGDFRDMSRATAQAIRAQAVNTLVGIPMIGRMTDEAKQEFAETLLVQAMLFSNFVDTHKGDRASMAKLATAVRRGAKAQGLDLDAMTLTDHGFVPAG